MCWKKKTLYTNQLNSTKVFPPTNHYTHSPVTKIMSYLACIPFSPNKEQQTPLPIPIYLPVLIASIRTLRVGHNDNFVQFHLFRNLNAPKKKKKNLSYYCYWWNPQIFLAFPITELLYNLFHHSVASQLSFRRPYRGFFHSTAWLSSLERFLFNDVEACSSKRSWSFEFRKLPRSSSSACVNLCDWEIYRQIS